jgi:DNA-binding MarR family transcriptional regulator
MEGLTSMQGWIIAFIYKKEQALVDVFQRDLEKEFDIRRSTVTGLIKLMEQNQLITREPVPQDRRLKSLKLTVRSRSIYERVSEKFRQMEDRLRTNIPEQEIGRFLEILEKIKQNIS